MHVPGSLVGPREAPLYSGIISGRIYSVNYNAIAIMESALAGRDASSRVGLPREGFACKTDTRNSIDVTFKAPLAAAILINRGGWLEG